MKLKFINLLLAAFLLIGSAQALTSCKDTDEDLYLQLRDENVSLQKKYDEDIDTLKAVIKRTYVLKEKFELYKDSLHTALEESYADKDPDSIADLLDRYIIANSTYHTLKEVLESLEGATDTFPNVGARFTWIETELLNFKNMFENTILGDTTAFNDFVSTTQEGLQDMGIDVDSLKTAVASLTAFKNQWETALPTISNNASNALAKAVQNEKDIHALDSALNVLKSMITKCNCDSALAAHQTQIDTLNAKLQTVLDNYVKKADLDAAIAGLATNDALDSLAALLRQEAQENHDSIEARFQRQINACISRLDGLDTTVGQLRTDLDSVAAELTQAKADILENTRKIEALQKSLDGVIVRVFQLENRISSIILQGTTNAVLGYLKTPFGIESNFLMNYMGENQNSQKVDFPNFLVDGIEYDGKLVMTPADKAFLQSCGITGAVSFAPGETLFSDADGNLGKVYLTLNPANIDLTGKEFAVVTSQNKVMPIELKNLRPSNAELTMGYTRTQTSRNGFYEADATVAANDVPALRVVVDNELKAAAKKVLSERSASSLLALGNAVYNQFNGFLPALGIRAAWQESDGAENPTMKEQSVYSHYGLAAATFNPLSYKFLYGRSFRQIDLPDLSGILDDYKFDFSDKGLNIEFKPITISGVNVNFSLNINPQIGDLNLGSVGTSTTVEITNYPTGVVVDEDDPDNSTIVSRYSDVAGQPGYKEGANGTATKIIPVDVSIDLNDSDLAANLKTSIEDALQSALSGLDDEINGQLQSVIDTLIGQIQGQVNDMMSSLETQVNTSLNDILGNLQDQVNGKIDMIGDNLANNALYARLQALINRFNGILADPNHLLQSTLLYSANGSFGMMSTSKSLPSQFKGGSAVMLTPTTFTGEIVSPAFKKFVAVTNVFKSDDYTVNAQAGDAKCKALAEAANALPYVNEVVSGERRTIPFTYEGGEGYTYEIVYSALDYSGYTSTAKYYVSIKK